MLAFSDSQVEVLVPLFALAIPIVAIIGGIAAGIAKTMSRHRVIELAQRERIAMIERGLDPSKLPPLPLADVDEAAPLLPPVEAARRRSQGLMIGGLVTLAVGVSLGAMLYYVADEPGVWAIGLIPAAIGIALLLGSALVRPRSGD